ncbi:uncharacterized protein LOC5511462 isoform X2 [Nematostella vectensis]|uniref:uncharacterized protein LOC5511462 isoform X2 n=1 Tax=Nematostella vectensis TaxID=45351 RepID=UPI00207733A8|nr:uncharacterized protein LOC5511462 isoform X2 [Nematostella vectensis]
MNRQPSACTTHGDMEETHSVLEEQTNAGDRVVINVGGQKHETYIGTLKNIPDTRLYWITENGTQLPEFDPNTSEFFFDRHPGVFAQVLNFYRTGKLHCPNDVCGPLFEDELAFWGIDELQVEPCCWLNYKQHREAQANLDPFDHHDSDNESVGDMDMSVYGLVADSIRQRNRTWWKKYQPRIWTMFEEPYSSIPAQVLAFITMFLIISSVCLFCLETVPKFDNPKTSEGFVLYILEAVCVAWFTLEFLVRLIFCPDKLSFFKKPMNWIDLGAILPFYLTLIVRESNFKTIVVLRVVRLIRVFRIFKLSRHSYGLQILGHTLRSSCSELFLLVFFLTIGVVIFSSVIFYAEKDTKGTHFTTIPHTFWWAVVTMTTLGYGDMVPITWQGQIVGSLCAVCGVLMIALPVPVIVSNFSLYYSHAKARMKLPRRKRPVIFGAASALRVAQPVVSSQSHQENHNVITQLIEDGIRINNDSDSDDERAINRSYWNSGRRSPRHSRPSSPRCRTPRNNIFTTPMITSTSASPRGSMAPPPESYKSRNKLIVPSIEEEIQMSECHQREDSLPASEVDGAAGLSVLPTKSESSSCALTTTPSCALTTTSLHPGTLATFASSPSLPVSPLVSSHSAIPSRAKSPLSLTISDGDSASTCSEVKSPIDKIRSMPSKSLSSESTTGSPRGRRGRRGSLYIVGYTAKHWQNKALKKPHVTSQKARESGANGSIKSPAKSPVCKNCSQSSRSDSTDAATNSKLTAEATSPKDFSSMGDTNGKLYTHHPELARVSSGTQTEEDKADSLRVHPSAHHVRHMSVESTDSTKMSDDSLAVYGERVRRGSSPLIRQHAIFTFDRNDSRDEGGIKGSPVKSRYPTGRRSTGSVRKKSPTNSDQHCDSKGCPTSARDVRPHSLPSGYINHSYQGEEEDSLPSRLSKDVVTTPASNRDTKKGFQPYVRSSNAPTQKRLSRNNSAPRYQSSHPHLEAVRTYSLPFDSVNHSFPLANNSLTVPVTHLRHLAITKQQARQKDQENFVPLLQRRQAPLLFVRVVSQVLETGRTTSPSWDYRPDMSPFHGTLTSPSGNVYVATTDEFTSGHASGLSSAASSGFTSAPGSETSDGGFIFPRYFSYSSSPSSLLEAASSNVGRNMRDTGTSPVSFHQDPPSLSSSGQGTFQPKVRKRSLSAPALGKVPGELEQRARSVEYELSPVSSARDSSGREYSVYAMPTELQRILLVSPETPGNRGNEYERELRDGKDKAEGACRKTQDGDKMVTKRETSPTIIINRSSTEHSSMEQPDGSSNTLTIIQKDPNSQGSRALHVTKSPVFESKSDPTLLQSGLVHAEALHRDADYRHSYPTTHPHHNSPHRLERSDHHVIYNGHDSPHRSSNDVFQVDRRRNLASPDRQRVRAMFFGDSGISSADSSSVTSMTYSMESEIERECGEKLTGNSALNPIREIEAENPASLPVSLPTERQAAAFESTTKPPQDFRDGALSQQNSKSSSTSSSSKLQQASQSHSLDDLNRQNPAIRTKPDKSSKLNKTILDREMRILDILSNSDLCETSVV